MIQKLNHFLTNIFDVLLYPFAGLNAFWGILFLSILMSFVVLYAYKWFSSPSGVKEAKEKIKAHILAIRLYKDLWKIIVSSFFKSLYYTGKYFLLNFGPLLVILPILIPTFMQMEVRYGIKPFDIGDQMQVKAAFNFDPNELNINLLENETFKPVMNPVFINADLKDGNDTNHISEVNWKLETVKTGDSAIRIKVGDRIYEKSFRVGDGLAAVSNKRMNASSWEHFLYPVEALLPADGEVVSVRFDYPTRYIQFAGITWHWLVLNLIIVLVVVLAFKNKFGIEF